MASTTKDKLTAAAAGAAIALVVSRYLKKQAPYDATHDEVRAIVRPNIRKLEPYRCARDDYEEGVLLDANENAYGACVKSDEALVKAALKFDLHRYPCPHQRVVKDRVAAFRGVKRDNVFVGVGSDEAIDLLFRVFCEPRTANVVVTPATYGMYKVCAATQDVEVRSANLLPESFDVDVDAVERAVDANTRLVFLCSPGNPTARQVPRKTVERLLASPKLQRSIIVVDEAYVDFASEPSTAPLVKKYPRLVVLHTLSKAFGLAGVRCGTAIGSAATIHYMNAVKAPYSINKMTSCLAAEALSAPSLAALKAVVKDTLRERERLAARLASLSYVCTVFPSDANFLLVRLKQHDKAKPLYTKLAESGVVVRYRGDQANLSGCIRVTVGTPSDSDALLKLLGEVAPSFGLI